MRVVKKLHAPHSLLFLSGSLSDMTVPPETGSALVCQSEDCITIWTVNELDDTPVEIQITDEVVASNVHPVFSGSLSTKYKEMILSDSNSNEIIRIPVNYEKTRVIIFVDHFSEPEFIQIRIISEIQ